MRKRFPFSEENFDDHDSPLKRGKLEMMRTGPVATAMGSGPFGPTDLCHASPLRAAGTPVVSRRRRVNHDLDSPTPQKKLHDEREFGSADGHLRRKKELEEEGGDAGETFVPRKAFRFEDLGVEKASSGGGGGGDEERRFTLTQVRRIVEGAVKDREKELREEYDNLLMDRLDEQWRTFAKFNEDHLHSKMKDSAYDYFC